MDHEDDDPGTTWNQRARAARPDWMSPRMAWRAIQAALPREAIISSDIGNNCAIGNAYPSFEEGRKYLAPGLFGPCGYGLPSIVGAKIACPDTPVVGFAGDGAFGIACAELTAIGRKEWPAITMVVFRNYQWGAEKRNSTLWYADNFVGTELDPQVSYAGIASACGLQGVQARTMDQLTAALAKAIEDQMQHGKTTLIEAMINQELGEPFRRDAMKVPVAVAGIDPADMRPQVAGVAPPTRARRPKALESELRLDRQQPHDGCYEPPGQAGFRLMPVSNDLAVVFRFPAQRAVGQLQPIAGLRRSFELEAPAQFGDQPPVLEDDPHLGIERDRARVEIERPDEAGPIVDGEGLGMKAGALRTEHGDVRLASERLQLEQLHAVAQQPATVSGIGAVNRRDIGRRQRIGQDHRLDAVGGHRSQDRRAFASRHEVGRYDLQRLSRLDWTSGSKVFISQFLRRRPIAFSGGSEMTVACSVQCMLSCSAMKSAIEARSRTRSRCGLDASASTASEARAALRSGFSGCSDCIGFAAEQFQKDSKMRAVCSTPLPSSSTSRSRKFVSAASK